MYYLVEAFGKSGLLAGQRVTIGLDVAKAFRDNLKTNPAIGEVSIYSTEITAGVIDKKEKLDV